MSCVPFVFQAPRFSPALSLILGSLGDLTLTLWTLYTLNNLTTLNYLKKEKKKLYDFHNLLLILMG